MDFLKLPGLCLGTDRITLKATRNRRPAAKKCALSADRHGPHQIPHLNETYVRLTNQLAFVLELRSLK
jgi:hypothetical protein